MALLIPIIEDLALINENGDRVFKRTVDAAMRWHGLAGRGADSQGDVLQICINVVVVQILSDRLCPMFGAKAATSVA